ncbi:hypothetical protein TNCV_4975181 [Trichonephila clavipes]|uniref:Uncharacterized protein n=1 Tax=Trichonephila clavipes TaxID=2585209 RepID=A0A8X6SS80_TRICX|nr:hypothetical protein TNCV_4975181 [Trichonephila clavipes]
MMPRKRKSNLSQRSNSARGKKVARFNETFPQGEGWNVRHQSSRKVGMQLTWRLREIQKPLKQLNLANVLLLKGHNSDA